MSLKGPINNGERLPPAYGGCSCTCHTISGVSHIKPCCYPSDDESVLSDTILDDIRRITMSDNKVTFETIRVPDGMSFSSLESEIRRTYVFPEKEVVIEAPVALNVSRSGGHRVIDENGKVHYIPKGWVELTWEVKNDALHVDF